MKRLQFEYAETAQDMDGVLTLSLGTQRLEISLYEDGAVRVRYRGENSQEVAAHPETGLPPLFIKEGKPLPGLWRETDTGWEIRQGLHLRVDLRPFALSLANSAGKVLLQQQAPQAYAQRGSRKTVTWSWDGHPLVGLGEKVGPLDKRGKELTLWNTDVVPHLPTTDPLYVSIPWLLSRSWGLFLQNSYRTQWDLGKHDPGKISIQADGGVLDQWIFVGRNPQEILGCWMERIGKMPMPPLWSIGHHQSRYSYRPQTQVLEVARTMREKHIPCDVMHLDIHHMDGYRDFTWDPGEFSDPDAMNRELHKMGFRVVTIVDPGVKKDEAYSVCADGLTEDVFCTKETGEPFVGEVWPGPALFPDFARTRVRAWWGEQQAKHLAHGMDGIWNDMNEPSVFNVPGKTFSPDVRHGEYAELSHAEIHNRYGSLMCQAAHEGLLKFAPDKRPFVLTRAGFAGIQRHAAVWLGDNSSWWEHLAEAVSMCLNMGLSGVSFVGTDIGGFLEDGEGELLARWAQLGTFTPFCRNHSDVLSRPQEAWAFGAEIERIYREAMALRYRLLPTLYSLFEEASVTGNPILRPLFWEFPEDDTAWGINDELLLGKDCLIAPIVQKGARERLVYLPAGVWQNRSSGQMYQGNRHIIAEAPLADIPLFLREGAILGLGCGGEVTRADLLQVETLEVYAHAPFSTTMNFYADAGEGYDYREGEYRRLNISGTFDGRTLTLAACQEGNWEHQERLKVEIHWDGKVSRHEWILADEFICLAE
ncbi:MAG: glycoside hydrolase family 31 protein [Desulfitobacteriaceae bacterium]